MPVGHHARASAATSKEHLKERGALLRGGTIVDATLIAASPSTKNKEGQRDPEMRQSKKGNQWYFGMKAHIGADAESGLIHTAGVTAGCLHDAKVMDNLNPRGRPCGLRRQGLRVWLEEADGAKAGVLWAVKEKAKPLSR
jgi:IS5 family transposase